MIALLLSTLIACQGPRPAAERKITVHVDPRVELVTIVARLAGFAEFNMPNSASPYADEVEEHFGPLREHAAVKALIELRAKRGVSHDALPSLAVHLGPLPALEERIPFDRPPERLDTRWGGAAARDFTAKLRAFAVESKAEEFFAAHRVLYDTVEQRFGEVLAHSKALPWFDSFFGSKPEALYVAITGLLCGGRNFGVGVRFGDSTPEEVTPVFGCWTFDPRGVPVFGEQYLPLLIHELCHTYTNPIVDRFEKELHDAAATIYASCAEQMKRQAYGNATTMLYESLVRASVVRCRLATEGLPAAEEQAKAEVSAGFRWVPELAKLMAGYENERATFPGFEHFMPVVVQYFTRYAKQLAELEAKRPHLVSITPANGATDVDPALTTMLLRFDRPMRDGGWSVVGSKTDTPEITGKLAYDAERKLLTIPVKLAAGRTYRFGLNSETSQYFASAEGVPLAPLVISFTTRK